MDLDWQNSLIELKDRGQYLLDSEKWADCRFLVGAHPNPRIISAHKLILAMASPVFERMFFGHLPDKTDPIVIPDVQPDAFEAMLEYMYADRITIASFDKACELCYVAKKYMLPHVVTRCTNFLWSDLSPKNACRAYEFAKLFDEPRLMQSSLDLIATNTREVLTDPSFLDIEVTTLMAILDLNRLNIDSELDLFNCLMKFASDRGILTETGNEEEASKSSITDQQMVAVEQIKTEPDVDAMVQHLNQTETKFKLTAAGSSASRSPGNASSSSHAAASQDDVVIIDSDGSGNENDEMTDAEREANMLNMMEAQRTIIDGAMLRQAVKKIRFLTMTPQQFAEGPARCKLLQPHEALAILIEISSPTLHDRNMPEGFCVFRSTRSFESSQRTRGTTAGTGNSGTSRPLISAPLMGGIPYLSQMQSGQSNNAPANGSVFGDAHDGGPPTQAAAPPSHDNESPRPTSNNRDMTRSYCMRSIRRQYDFQNTSVADAGVTFQVDANLWILGVLVPTQVLCGELMNSGHFSERYTEVIYAHIQDMHGSRIAYTHVSARVRYGSHLDINFDRPVYIYRNQIYKIYVVFNKSGWYPFFSCVPEILRKRVKFMFNVGNPTESVRDGLIYGLIISTPSD